jgi:hypothetical protein
MLFRGLARRAAHGGLSDAIEPRCLRCVSRTRAEGILREKREKFGPLDERNDRPPLFQVEFA